MSSMTGKQSKYPKRGDIYWICLDPSQGTEIKKTRPAVIISNNLFNKNLNRVIVAPITSNIKNIFDFDCLVIVQNREGKIMLDQMRTIDKSRLKQKITSLDPQTLKNLEKVLKLTLDLV